MRYSIVGVGAYGIAVAKEMSMVESISKTIAIDSDKKILDDIGLEDTIYISKRLSAYDAVDRIKGKLKKRLAGIDIVFMVSNPIDLSLPYVLPYMIEYIKSLGVIVVALAIDPYGKFDRERKKIAKRVVDYIVGQTATVRIPQKNFSLYGKANYDWYEYSISEYRGRDEVYEQIEFDKWYKQFVNQCEKINRGILVGVFYLQRMLELLNARFPNDTSEEIRRILEIPGIVHVAAAYGVYVDITDSFVTEVMSKHEFARVIRTRAMFNEILGTSAHGSEGLIFELTVPMNMQKEDVAEFAYMLHTFSLENTHSVFTINTIVSEVQEVSVKLIATGADDMNEKD